LRVFEGDIFLSGVREDSWGDKYEWVGETVRGNKMLLASNIIRIAYYRKGVCLDLKKDLHNSKKKSILFVDR
jgi:hypothetical protein